MNQDNARLHRSTLGSARSRRNAPSSRVMCALSLATLVLLLSGCGTTVFQSGFNSNTVGAPPSPTQLTGTIQVGGDASSVLIAGPPPNSTGNWAQIQRTAQQESVSTMTCTFSKFLGNGTYSLTASLFIPSGSGLATVSFGTGPQGAPPYIDFLHFDFMQNNTVRINDDGKTAFGTFPRDQVFSITVSLNITGSNATAHMQLFGTGASGSADYNVTPLALAQQLGDVKFWMGYPWAGSFKVTNIVVVKQ